MLRKITVAVAIIMLAFWSSAYADYPYANVCPSPAGGRYLSQDIDQWNFYKCECVSYTSYMLNAYGIDFDNSYRGASWSNGGNWNNAAGSIDGQNIVVDSYPLPGDIAYWEYNWTGNPDIHYDDFGHVAFVEKVHFDSNGNPTSIDVSEYNFNNAYDYGTRSNVSVNSPSGYIHILAYNEGVAGLYYLDSYEMNASGQTKAEWKWIMEKVWSDYRCKSNCGPRLYSQVWVDSMSNIIGLGGGPGTYTVATEDPTPLLPDFTVNEVWLETPWGVEAYKYGSPETMKMKAQFKNIGEGSCSGDIEAHFYLSKGYKEDPHSGDGSWTRVGTDYIHCDNLDPGETHTETEGIELWRDIPEPGIWNIVACIDHTQDDHNNGGAYPEEHESNNCSTEAVFEVTADGQVVNVIEYDFIVSSIQLANTPVPVPANGLMGATMAIRNNGNATSPTNIRSNYSINGPGTNGLWVQIADDESLASELTPGRDQWEQIITLVNAPTVSGTYTLRGCADYQNAVAETDETNNCSDVQFTVQPPMPDFIIHSMGIAGGNTSFKAGTKLHPAMYVKNIGNANSPSAIRSSYYYSGPQTGYVYVYITDDGTEASELCAGCQMREEYDGGIKVSTRGTYYFQGCADYQGVVTESNETNNCTTSGPITIY
jgi:hypothetical protein